MTELAELEATLRDVARWAQAGASPGGALAACTEDEVLAHLIVLLLDGWPWAVSQPFVVGGLIVVR